MAKVKKNQYIQPQGTDILSTGESGGTKFLREDGDGTCSWQTVPGGSGSVDSVNGQIGVVVLDKTDIGLGNVDNTSDLNKPISTATQTALDGKVDENVAITGATKTKITYDAKGLVTGGADATTADIAPSTDRNYVTDADVAKLGHITVTQAVDLDQMETDIAALANGMVYKGNWDASAGTFPGAGVTQTGWFYTVSVGGTVDSIVFNVGDRLIATTDNASATTYAGNWTALDATDAVTSVNGQVGNVVLDADDIDDSTTAHKFVTATDITTLSNTSGVNTGDQTITLTGDVTGSGTGSFAATIANDAVTFAKMQNITTNRILGRQTAGNGDIEELTATSIPAMIGLGTSDSPHFTGVNVGHATDTTITRVSAGQIAVEGVNVSMDGHTHEGTAILSTGETGGAKFLREDGDGTCSWQTVSGGAPTTTTITSSATPTPTGDATDNRLIVTALAVDATIAAPTGTAVDGNKLLIRIQDNGTARVIAYNAIFRAVGVTLPTTTVLSKTLYLGAVYNSADSKRDVIATAQEA